MTMPQKKTLRSKLLRGSLFGICLVIPVWSVVTRVVPRNAAPPFINSVGVQLPPDAAPPEAQVLRTLQQNYKYMDQSVTGYSNVYGTYLLAEPLLRMDRDFNLLPAAAPWVVITQSGGLSQRFPISARSAARPATELYSSRMLRIVSSPIRSINSPSSRSSAVLSARLKRCSPSSVEKYS